MQCRHVLSDCQAVEELRESLGIGEFLRELRARGHSSLQAYAAYINGLDLRGQTIDQEEHFARGEAIHELQEKWIGVWDSQVRDSQVWDSQVRGLVHNT